MELQKSNGELESRNGAVIAVLLRYATAIDSKDWDLLARCFTLNSRFVAGEMVLQGLGNIVDYMQRAHEPLDGSLHRLSNFEVQIADDGVSAQSTTYLDAIIVHRAHERGPTLQVIGTYYDRLENDGTIWRITNRRFQGLWKVGDPSLMNSSQA